MASFCEYRMSYQVLTMVLPNTCRLCLESTVASGQVDVVHIMLGHQKEGCAHIYFLYIYIPILLYTKKVRVSPLYTHCSTSLLSPTGYLPLESIAVAVCAGMHVHIMLYIQHHVDCDTETLKKEIDYVTILSTEGTT